MRLEVADAGADFDDASGQLQVNERKDAPVKTGINFPQQRFGFPAPQVLLNFSLMLRERSCHRNFSRRAAKMTMRSSNQPCDQRWMFVSP